LNSGDVATVERAMVICNIVAFRDRAMSEVSGGERLLARALAVEAEIQWATTPADKERRPSARAQRQLRRTLRCERPSTRRLALLEDRRPVPRSNERGSELRPTTDKIFNVALLHLAPKAGDLAFNKFLIEAAIMKAAAGGADWVITPELAVSGYTFAPMIGTDWICVQPDPWMARIGNLAARLGIVVFLSVPERDADSNLLYNATFVIDHDGTICGKHRKVNPLRVGSEAWSTPGTEVNPIVIGGLNVGVMICADAYSPGTAKRLHSNGAQLLVSPAAWAPGEHGPKGEWERATSDTGLALFVCNRTGQDPIGDFSCGESVLAHGGSRLISAASEVSVALLFAWNFAGSRPESNSFRKIALE
jgi:5-aminopentanamidase